MIEYNFRNNSTGVIKTANHEFTITTTPITFEKIKKVWDLIQDNYTLIEQGHLIYLEPSLYWTIYKKLDCGKNIIKLTIPYHLGKDNYHFCQPQFYFEDHEFTDDYGIYGLYHGDDLIYIGLTKQGFDKRWEQHKDGLDNGAPQKLYTFGLRSNDVEMRPLIRAQDIKELMPKEVKQVSMQVLEFMEYALLKVLRPIGNVQGVSTSYDFKNSALFEEIPLDYIYLMKMFFEDEDQGYGYKAKEKLKELMENTKIE